MNLVVDIGNTATKWACFEGDRLVRHGCAARFDGGEAVPSADGFERVLACASGNAVGTVAEAFGDRMLSAFTPLPIHIAYKSPATLGADRIAAACGAWSLHRGENCLVVDAGTCITVDFLSADGVYHGGAIMPGLAMNLQSLHTFTAKLPLISLDDVEHAPLLGRTTEESILAGTLGATMLALAGYVAAYRQKCGSLSVVLTGGDAGRLVAAGATEWDYRPHLTLIGLNEIILTSNNE